VVRPKLPVPVGKPWSGAELKFKVGSDEDAHDMIRFNAEQPERTIKPDTRKVTPLSYFASDVCPSVLYDTAQDLSCPESTGPCRSGTTSICRSFGITRLMVAILALLYMKTVVLQRRKMSWEAH
jgi:hypothetical protein